MKRSTLINTFLLTVCLGVCGSLEVLAQYKPTFTIEKEIKATEVRNQQNTGTCWSFSTTSFLESEMIRMGKAPIDLSEMYLVQKVYMQKAHNYVLRQGLANFSQGALSHDLMNAYAKYGTMPEASFSGKNMYDMHDHSELESVLKAMLGAVVASKAPSPYWSKAAWAVLETYMGQAPKEFTYEGKTYTAEKFGKEVVGIQPKEYVQFTSFTHEPYYSPFILSVPDNFSNGAFINLPLNELEEVIENALAQGFSISWDADVSEPGFSPRMGVALNTDKKIEQFENMPPTELAVTPDSRQAAYESWETTDDHLMHIVGTAKDENGGRFYLVKNSWGANVGPYNGYIYVSSAYLKAKTVSILLHKKGVPAKIASKCGL